MHDLGKLKDLVYREIDKEVEKGTLTPDTVRTIGCAVDILKDISTIDAMEDYGEDEYSGRYHMPYYAYDDMGDRSYARKRDRMGRFSRRGYSRDDKIEHLERMMNEARDEGEKELYRKLIVRMENE